MCIHVEPENGRELDRLITVILNLTGVVSRAIETAVVSGDAVGVGIIDRIATELRIPLAPVAEHYDDADLALVVEVLATMTLLAAEDIGLGPAFLAG